MALFDRDSGSLCRGFFFLTPFSVLLFLCGINLEKGFVFDAIGKMLLVALRGD